MTARTETTDWVCIMYHTSKIKQ